MDWAEGLYAIQIAQIEMQILKSRPTNKNWKIIEVIKESGRLDQDMEIDTMKKQFDSFLAPFYDCYIYAYNDISANTFWFYLKFYTSEKPNKIRVKRQSGFLVYYPETAYVFVNSSWTNDINPYVNEAILHIFSGDKLAIQKVSAAHYDDTIKQVINSRSLGVFSQLRNNEADSNPLDIRQKRSKGFLDNYTSPGEKRRRILPVDIDEMKERQEAIDNYFGPSELMSYLSLDIELKLPLKVSDETELVGEIEDDEEENNIQIDINLKGTSVVEGLRQMVLSGTIESPPPPWLENVASSAASKIYLHKDGVSKEEYESDNNHEHYTLESIIAEGEEDSS
ncbi:hypothetical protein G6F56_002696 [Rhizopus delemar]|nr:hypothetical protein G6F56_002696 [Rhizopus delemar]